MKDEAMKFEAQFDEGSGGGGGAEKNKLLKFEELSEELKSSLRHFFTDFETRDRVVNSSEPPYPTDSYVLEFLDSYYPFIEKLLKEGELMESDISLKKLNKSDNGFDIDTDSFKRFFEQSEISESNIKLFLYSLLCDRWYLSRAIEGKKYQGLSEEDLDVGKTKVGKQLQELGMNPYQFLKIKNKDIDRHSYSRADIGFISDEVVKGALQLIESKSDDKLKEKLIAMIDACDKDDKRIEQENEKKHEEKIDSIADGIEVTSATRQVIEENLSPYSGGLKVVDKDTVVVWEERHSRSGNSGVAMYSDLSVYVNGHKQTKSLQWRDAFSSGNDNSGLRINEVTEAKSEDKGDKVEVTVTTDKGQNYVFEFDKEGTTEQREKLSPEQLESLKNHFESEVDKLMDQYNEWYKSSPKIPSAKGEKLYLKPRIVSKEISEYGFGIVQIERQTDHRGENDPQMMNHLFLIRLNKAAEEIVENHGYQSEQKGQLSIVSVNGIDGTIEYSVDGSNQVYKLD